MENHGLEFKASSAMNLGNHRGGLGLEVPEVSRVTSTASQRHERLGKSQT